MAGFLPTETDFMTIEELEKSGFWPVTWTSVLGIIPYIKRLGPDLIGLEIGIARAESSYVLLEKCPNIKTLYGIDPYKAYEDWNGTVDQEHNDKTKEIALKNMEKFGDRYKPLFHSNSKFHIDNGSFDNNFLDFIFIDGDHSYEGAKSDMKDYYPLVKSGGIFSGHDYNLPTVRKALENFRTANKIRIPINLSENSTWYWVKA